MASWPSIRWAGTVVFKNYFAPVFVNAFSTPRHTSRSVCRPGQQPRRLDRRQARPTSQVHPPTPRPRAPPPPPLLRWYALHANAACLVLWYVLHLLVGRCCLVIVARGRSARNAARRRAAKTRRGAAAAPRRPLGGRRARAAAAAPLYHGRRAVGNGTSGRCCRSLCRRRAATCGEPAAAKQRGACWGCGAPPSPRWQWRRRSQ